MVMEDYNLLDYNQHQTMKIAPTLRTESNLVFLAPTKKGLRSLILKCKILLASLMPIFDCHQSAAQPSLLIILCSLISAGQPLLITLCQSTHQQCWSISAHVHITIIIKSMHASRYQDHHQGLQHHHRVCIIIGYA